jgi:hypothetical protein
VNRAWRTSRYTKSTAISLCVPLKIIPTPHPAKVQTYLVLLDTTTSTHARGPAQRAGLWSGSNGEIPLLISPNKKRLIGDDLVRHHPELPWQSVEIMLVQVSHQTARSLNSEFLSMLQAKQKPSPRRVVPIRTLTPALSQTSMVTKTLRSSLLIQQTLREMARPPNLA